MIINSSYGCSIFSILIFCDCIFVGVLLFSIVLWTEAISRNCHAGLLHYVFQALAKTLTIDQLFYLRGQFALLGPNKSGQISLQNMKMVSYFYLIPSKFFDMQLLNVHETSRPWWRIPRAQWMILGWSTLLTQWVFSVLSCVLLILVWHEQVTIN